jgi:TonB family protein
VPRAKPKASPTIVPKREEALSPIDDGLSEAFGGNDSSVTETIAGFASTVARTFSSKMKKPTTEPAVATAMAVAIDPAAASAGSGGSLWSNPRNLGTGAAAVVVIIGLLFWIFSGTEEPTVADEPLADTPINVAEPVFETDVVAPQQTEVDDLIDEAQLAADAGQIFTPPGSNAIELYMSALAVAPGDPVAEAGLQQVVERALSMAESALLERRSEDAEAALQRVALANPENPRLPFLHAQLAQIQLRNFLDDARQAIRDLRFEDAQLSLDGARQLTVTDASEIDVVADELSAALSAQRVDDVLAQASTRLAEGKLIAPSNDNARFYYELALSNDPANSAARQGLQVVAGKLVLQARAEIDAGNFEAADALLIDSRRLDPSSSELAAAATALNAARDRQVQEARRAAERKAAAEKAAAEQAAAEKLAAERAAAEKLAAEQAAAEKLAAERAAAEKAAAEKALAEQAAAEKLAAERAAAEKLAAEQAAAEKALAEQAAAERAAAEKLAAERAAAEQAAAEEALAEQATAERAAAEKLAADVPVAAIAAAGVAGGARPDGDALAGQVGKTAQTAGSSAAADTKQAAGQASPPPLQPSSAATRAADPVSVSSLNRIKYVAPRYPRVAQRRGLSGWVDVVFTVDIDGTVTDVSIRDSDPGDTFVSSAVSAVEDWEFEPVIEDGVAVQKRAAVRMMFAME